MITLSYKIHQALLYLFVMFNLGFFSSSCGRKSGNKDSSVDKTAQNSTSADSKSNDTIHANLAAKDANTGVPIDGGVMIVTNTIMQNIGSSKAFSTFKSALEQAGLDRALEGRGPFTVFLPPNDAFSKDRKSTRLNSSHL